MATDPVAKMTDDVPIITAGKTIGPVPQADHFVVNSSG